MKKKIIQNLVIGVCIILVITTCFQVLMLPKFGSATLGQLGDMMGGMSAPIINLFSAILVYMAFKVQVKANKIQIRNFNTQIVKQDAESKHQQFESQFYEMLSLHKQNVNEFTLIEHSFNSSNFVASALNSSVTTIHQRNVFVQFQYKFQYLLESYKELYQMAELTNKAIEECYSIFFFGYNSQFSVLINEDQYIRSALENNIDKYFKLVFPGYSHMLGHYYRHLYHTVCLVHENKNLVYEKKMIYLDLLRAQLSNQEQAMLFYNWLGGYGKNWENDLKEQYYFTEYNLIRNLWYDRLLDDNFIKLEVEKLQSKPVRFRKKAMFENEYKPRIK